MQVVGCIAAANSNWEQGCHNCILYLTRLLRFCDPGSFAGSADQCILVNMYLKSNLPMRQVLDFEFEGCSGVRAFLAALLTPRVLQKSMLKVLLKLQQLSYLTLRAPDSCHPQAHTRITVLGTDLGFSKRVHVLLWHQYLQL